MGRMSNERFTDLADDTNPCYEKCQVLGYQLSAQEAVLLDVASVESKICA